MCACILLFMIFFRFPAKSSNLIHIKKYFFNSSFFFIKFFSFMILHIVCLHLVETKKKNFFSSFLSFRHDYSYFFYYYNFHSSSSSTQLFTMCKANSFILTLATCYFILCVVCLYFFFRSHFFSLSLIHFFFLFEWIVIIFHDIETLLLLYI